MKYRRLLASGGRRRRVRRSDWRFFSARGLSPFISGLAARLRLQAALHAATCVSPGIKSSFTVSSAMSSMRPLACSVAGQPPPRLPAEQAARDALYLRMPFDIARYDAGFISDAPHRPHSSLRCRLNADLARAAAAASAQQLTKVSALPLPLLRCVSGQYCHAMGAGTTDACAEESSARLMMLASSISRRVRMITPPRQAAGCLFSASF